MSDELKSAREFAEKLNEECVNLVLPSNVPSKGFHLARCAELILSRDKLNEEAALRRAAASVVVTAGDLYGSWGASPASMQDVCDHILALISAPGALAAHDANLIRCDVCCGVPLPSGKKCICDGQGTVFGALTGLRLEILRMERERADHDREIERKARLEEATLIHDNTVELEFHHKCSRNGDGSYKQFQCGHLAALRAEGGTNE